MHRDLDIHGLNPRTLIRAARRAAVNSAEARRRIAYECSAGQDETESRLASDHAEKFLPHLSDETVEAPAVMKSFLLERRFVDRDPSLED